MDYAKIVITSTDQLEHSESRNLSDTECNKKIQFNEYELLIFQNSFLELTTEHQPNQKAHPQIV